LNLMMLKLWVGIGAVQRAGLKIRSTFDKSANRKKERLVRKIWKNVEQMKG
jgi:hypothetical protein